RCSCRIGIKYAHHINGRTTGGIPYSPFPESDTSQPERLGWVVKIWEKNRGVLRCANIVSNDRVISERSIVIDNGLTFDVNALRKHHRHGPSYITGRKNHCIPVDQRSVPGGMPR